MGGHIGGGGCDNSLSVTLRTLSTKTRHKVKCILNEGWHPGFPFLKRIVNTVLIGETTNFLLFVGQDLFVLFVGFKQRIQKVFVSLKECLFDTFSLSLSHLFLQLNSEIMYTQM